MKKIICILTAMIMTVIALSCGVSVSAGDMAETSSGNELIAGNVSEKQLPNLKFELADDHIKFTTKNYYLSNGIIMIITNDKFECIGSKDDPECIFKPDANGKYMIIAPVGIPESYGSFGYNAYDYYIMLVECHDNIVDINVNNMYSITSKYNYEKNTPATITPLSGKSFDNKDQFSSDYALINFTFSFFEENEYLFVYYGVTGKMSDKYPFTLILRGMNADFRFFSEDGNEITDTRIFPLFRLEDERINCISINLGDYSEEWREDTVINEQITKYIFKEEGRKITKYTIVYDVLTWLNENGEELTSDLSYCPYSFISEVINENDVNCDGKFNISDAVMLCRYLHGLGGMNVFNARMADICRDEVLDVFDYCILKNRLLSAVTA